MIKTFKISRRDKLTNDLKLFVSTKILNHNLPLIPTHVYGFGSFFRAKENPNDIDLIVVYDKNHYDTHKDDIKNEFDDWLDRVTRCIIDCESNDCRQCTDHGISSCLYNNFRDIPEHIVAWFSSYSKSKLFPKTTVDQILLGTPLNICERMLYKIRKVKVMDQIFDVSALRCPNTLVWSTDKRNIDDNLAIASNNIREFLIDEFRNLEGQYWCMAAYSELVDICKPLWYNGVKITRATKTLFVKFCDDAHRNFFDIPTSTIINHLDTDRLRMLVEWLREEVKCRKACRSLIMYVYNCLIQYSIIGMYGDDCLDMIHNDVVKKYNHIFGKRLIDKCLKSIINDIKFGFVDDCPMNRYENDLR